MFHLTFPFLEHVTTRPPKTSFVQSCRRFRPPFLRRWRRRSPATYHLAAFWFPHWSPRFPPRFFRKIPAKRSEEIKKKQEKKDGKTLNAKCDDWKMMNFLNLNPCEFRDSEVICHIFGMSTYESSRTPSRWRLGKLATNQSSRIQPVQTWQSALPLCPAEISQIAIARNRVMRRLRKNETAVSCFVPANSSLKLTPQLFWLVYIYIICGADGLHFPQLCTWALVQPCDRICMRKAVKCLDHDDQKLQHDVLKRFKVWLCKLLARVKISGRRCTHTCLKGPHDTARQCTNSNSQQWTYKPATVYMADLNWPNKNLELGNSGNNQSFPTSPASSVVLLRKPPTKIVSWKCNTWTKAASKWIFNSCIMIYASHIVSCPCCSLMNIFCTILILLHQLIATSKTVQEKKQPIPEIAVLSALLNAFPTICRARLESLNHIL